MKIFVFCLVSVFAFCFPVGLFVFLKKKTGCRVWPVFAGAICFLFFAMGLEQIPHMLVLKPNGKFYPLVMGSPFVYTLYASFAAGIFEETGRLFGYKVLLRKHDAKTTALAYGIGHGGIEVILVLGSTYLIYVLALMGIIKEPAILNVANTVDCSISFIAAFERISAMMVQVGLSMIMFKACREKGKFWLYPVAIVFHAAVDAVAGLYQFGVVKSLFIVECYSFAMGLLALFVGKRIFFTKEEILPESENSET